MSDGDPTADAFMARILADPADPWPRLLFADWLEETGTASSVAWARFLRLAEELAAAPADDPRRRKLAGELERVGTVIRAQLTCRAELVVAYPEPMLRLLPPRCLVVNPDRVQVPRPVCDFLPYPYASLYGVLPLAHTPTGLLVAVPVGFDRRSQADLHRFLATSVTAVFAPADSLQAAIDRHYPPPPPPPTLSLALNPAA
jgi:uncharacterized protein (TIGR02996 family)